MSFNGVLQERPWRQTGDGARSRARKRSSIIGEQGVAVSESE